MTLLQLPKSNKLSPEDAYRDVVHPALVAVGLVPRGELVHAEGTTQDERAGIDWIVAQRNGTITTLATRAQWDRDYGTFSIRWRTGGGSHNTELLKRYRSVMNGGSYPTLTIQAYVSRSRGELINAYVVRTEDLYRHVIMPAGDDPDATTFRTCGCAGHNRPAPGGALFIPVAITERGRMAAESKATLIGHGITVGMVRAQSVGYGMGL